MEYQKIINFLENTSNQPTKFRTKCWFEVNYKSPGTYNLNSQIKYETSTLTSSLCGYSDAYILASTTITVPNTSAAAAAAAAAGDSSNSKNIIIKNCTPFTNA